ncbi:MAG: luciferase family protein [Bacteroidia bacterium]
MFDLAVKYFGFLKHVPLLPHAFDGLLKMSRLISNRAVLDHMDEIEKEALLWEGVSLSAHKFGGLQFNVFEKEIGHIHGNGLLDILFNREIKAQLISERKAKEHHVFKNSGWISLTVVDEVTRDRAVELLRLSYSKIREGRRAGQKKEPTMAHKNGSAPFKTVFLIFSWLLTSFALTWYSGLLSNYIGATSFGREFLVCGGQIVFQFTLLFLFREKSQAILDYLVQMMTVSLFGSVLLIPALFVHHFFPHTTSILFLCWFMLVVAFMLYEHIRRVKRIGAPKWLSASWVSYRILVLLLILFL